MSIVTKSGFPETSSGGVMYQRFRDCDSATFPWTYRYCVPKTTWPVFRCSFSIALLLRCCNISFGCIPIPGQQNNNIDESNPAIWISRFYHVFSRMFLYTYVWNIYIICIYIHFHVVAGFVLVRIVWVHICRVFFWHGTGICLTHVLHGRFWVKTKTCTVLVHLQCV